MSPEPVLGDSGSRHLRTPSLVRLHWAPIILTNQKGKRWRGKKLSPGLSLC